MENPKYPEIPIFKKIDNVLTLVSLYPDGISASELLKSTDIPRATLYRILYQLCNSGYLSNTKGNLYVSGNKLTHLRSSDIERHSNIQYCAANFLSDLSLATGKTVKLSVRIGLACQVLCCAKNDDDLLSYLKVGTVYPLHAGAASKILMSTLTTPEFRIYFSSQAKAHTAKTIITSFDMKNEIETIQRQGFATDEGEFQQEICALAYPIIDTSGNIIAAISVVGEVAQDFETILQSKDLIKKCADDISQKYQEFLLNRYN